MQKTKLLLNILALFLCILPAVSMAQGGGNVTVSGIVTSADDKQPLIGVNVISGATSGVSTLADGTYRITVSAGTTLTFQYIGYKPFEFTVPAGRSSVTCDVALQGDSQTLDDVVVIAYGVRKKGTIAGSVSTVKAEKIEDTPAAAFDQALQGQVPGLTVLSDSGEPSEAAAMAIRGTNSINSGTAPLYILDGVAISSRDFNTINPSDIESLSVLKDASSTSIYGARAANGVIVITTKRGRMADRAKINYRMQLGFSQIAYGNWDLMNTSERIQYEKELGLTDGKNYNVLAKTDVNWLDEVFSNAALLQNYELSVSGASEKTNYYVSGGYYSQDGTAVGSSFERYSIRANVEQRAAKWLKLGTNTMMNYQTIEKADDGEYTLTTPISAARFMLPYWNPHRAGGSLASVNDGSWKGEGQNPLEWLKNNPVDYKKYKIISTVFAEATPIEGLTLRSQFGVDYSHSTGRGISYPSYAPNLGSGTVQRNSSDGMSLSVTNTITYRFDIDNKHMFTILAGQEGLDYRYEAFSLQTKDQNNDKLVNISSSPRATRWSDTTDDNYAYLSFFGRAEYSYSDRYYADFSLRTDGSSRFGSNNRYGIFPSFSAGWRISQEDFLKDTWVDNLKLRLSWGKLGNNSIGNYDYLSTYASGYSYPFGGKLASGAVSTLSNDLLEWETTTSFDVGLEFATLKNRLTFEADYYDKQTDGILYKAPVYATIGNKSAPYQNLCGVSNRGFEFTIGWRDQVKNFRYGISANFTRNWNKVTKYNGRLKAGWVTDANGVRSYVTNIGDVSTVVDAARRTIEGRLINEYILVNTYSGDGSYFFADGSVNPAGGPRDGMIRTPDDMTWLEAMVAAGNSFLPNQHIAKDGIWYGDYIYEDANGNGVYGDSNDYTFQNVSQTPKYYYGFNIELGWKGIDFSARFAGAGGGARYWRYVGYNAYSTNPKFTLPYEIAYDHYFFDPENPDDPRTNLTSKHGRLTMNYGSEQNGANIYSTLFLYKTDYLKLKNLTIGYTLPERLTRKVGIGSLRIFLTGDNLFTITDYPGIDPEFTDNMNYYANLRQYTIGLNIKF